MSPFNMIMTREFSAIGHQNTTALRFGHKATFVQFTGISVQINMTAPISDPKDDHQQAQGPEFKLLNWLAL
jgi:hypothetical protein